MLIRFENFVIQMTVVKMKLSACHECGTKKESEFLTGLNL